MKKSKILVCGGREFKDRKLLHDTMAKAKLYFADYYCIINGFARGADMMAHSWAFFEGCCSICVPANWDFYDDKAGSIRNKWMLDFVPPDLVIAFPGGSGTADMVKQSRARGIDVWEVPNE